MYDLLIMMEQVENLEDVTENHFKLTLSRLKSDGFFITKKPKYRPIKRSGGRVGDLYLRVK